MHSKRCQIIFPIHRVINEKEKLILIHNASFLTNVSSVFVGPEVERVSIEKLRADIFLNTGIEICVELFEDSYFESISGYNTLLMSRAFFERFTDYEYVLICQLDALILNNNLSHWLDAGYSFIGPPHLKGFNRPIEPFEFLASQNGGFSLRRVCDSLKVFDKALLSKRSNILKVLEKTRILFALNAILSKRHKIILPVPEAINEDIFWSKIVPYWFDWYRIPPPEEAAHFAFEVCPQHLFKTTKSQLPFGCHAFDKYDPSFWKSQLTANIAKLIEMED